jgi:uncharacterized OB-fold protein
LTDSGLQIDAPAASIDASVPTGRERPIVNQDNEFFWDGIAQHRLLAQRCKQCGAVRHPPQPTCSKCHSPDWDVLLSSGHGVVYSYVTVHHPPTPGFELPYVVVLAQFEEGFRLAVSTRNLGVDDVAIGAAIDIAFVEDGGFWYPEVVPVTGEGRHNASA